MKKAIIECVPNFSEGRDVSVVEKIRSAIDSVEPVKVLHVDRGEAANRTVITFLGEAEAVVEAAFRGVKAAQEHIDMRMQTGEHPRIGATDVLPLIPVSGISLEQCAELARGLAQRISTELLIPTYCYEAAAFRPDRKRLEVCRAGQYEGLADKLLQPDLQPDFGARSWDEVIAKSGATVVGARKFLIAVNFNLNTTSKTMAHDIACAVRTSGRGGQPGLLPATKAIGWFIEEYGIAQVSMNLTDMDVTPLHVAYETVCEQARLRGVCVTGTEIIGLVPRVALIEAGRYFMEKEVKETASSAVGLTDEEAVALAVSRMHLDDLCPFDVNAKILG